MDQLTIPVVISELERLQSRIDPLGDAEASRFLASRIADYRDKQASAPPATSSRDDHARAHILNRLEKRIRNLPSPLTKRKVAEEVQGLVEQCQQAAKEQGEEVTVDFGVTEHFFQELYFLRQSLQDQKQHEAADRVSERISQALDEWNDHVSHPPRAIVDLQVSTLKRFGSHVQDEMPSPLRKNALTTELLAWALFFREGR